MQKNKTCYVTTPIYYASGNVHIGNSYSTVVCDIFARYHRLKGYDTFFLTGMDEHGQKIEEAAALNKKDPQTFVNEIADSTRALWKDLNITNDDFIQTSELRHTTVVQKIFEEMLKNDDIYLGKYEGDYCVSCESFYTKTQLGDSNTCPDCGKPTIKVQEESYFLRLKKYQDRLLKFIEDNPDFIQPETRKNEVISFVKQGLEDLCVSRTSYKWGIPVISNPKHVIYVWIDALCNYITSLGYGSNNDELYKKFWLNGEKVIHVVGKDILRFHAVYWPIMLMTINVPINYKLYVHGWILMKEGKMSKSKGNVVYPRDVSNRYGLDSLRYYLAREMPLGNDCIFSYERFLKKYNTDLVNDLGNLVKRSIAMVNKYFNGHITKPDKNYYDFDIELEQLAKGVIKKYNDSFSNFRIQNGLNEVWDLIARTNKYIDETAPWVVAKNDNEKDKLNSIMYHLLESIRLINIMITPVMPDTSIEICKQLGISKELRNDQLTFGLLEEFSVNESDIALFKRLDIEEELKYQESITTPKVEKIELKPEITIDDFSKIDLRIGEVVEAVKMENSDKLLVLKIKIENEVRQIVSGIAKNYQAEEMIGKKVVIVANLKPVKLRGYMSEGMILAASSDDKDLEVIEVKKEDCFAKVH